MIGFMFDGRGKREPRASVQHEHVLTMKLKPYVFLSLSRDVV